MPEELLRDIGELTVLFGRLEHMVLLNSQSYQQYRGRIDWGACEDCC
jgi:hypothetical protein